MTLVITVTTRCGGDEVVVVGAGNSAGQAVCDLTRAGARVTMVVRGDDLASSMSAYLIRRIEANALVQVRLGSQVVAADGHDGRLSRVTIHDAGGATVQVATHAMFVCIGGEPHTEWATRAGMQTDDRGYLVTGLDLIRNGRPSGWTLARDPFPLETNEPGFFAAGDVRSGSIKRVAGAVGESA
jgi:thioredoxin reductase (NADPH)